VATTPTILNLSVGIDKKEEIIFKPNHGGHLTRPTVTISCHPINIRKEMSSGLHKF